MDFEANNCYAQEMYSERTQPFETVLELQLPDYRSEISRLLWVRPCFSAPARFDGGGRSDFSGSVRYEILYVGPDGGLYGAESEESYAFSLHGELPAGLDAGAGVETSVSLATDSVLCRVTAPRKLSVRCRLHADVRCFGMRSLEPRFEGERTAEPIELIDLVECGRYYGYGSETVEVQGEVSPECEGELRVVSMHGEVFLPEVSVVGNAVRVGGSVELTVLCVAEGEDARPFALPLSLPLEAEVPMEAALSDCRARALGSVCNMAAQVEEGRIALTAGVMLYAEAEGSEQLPIKRDLFLPGSKTDCRFEERTLLVPGFCGNRNFSVHEELDAAALMLPEGAELIDAFCTAEVKEQTSDGKRMTLGGELICRMLYLAEGEPAAAEARVPFRTVVDGCGNESTVCISVPKCRVYREGTRLVLDAEVAMALRSMSRTPTQLLTEVKAEKQERMPRGDLELCYPMMGESLFEVGRRYGVDPARIASENNLTEVAPGDAAGLAGVRYLVIP